MEQVEAVYQVMDLGRYVELCRINADGTVHAGDEQVAAVLELLRECRHEPLSEDLARRLIQAALAPLARTLVRSDA